MTTRQISQEIDQALANVNFQDWDFCDQLSALFDDVVGGTVDDESIESEVEELLGIADVGNYLFDKIKNALVKAIKNETA